MVEIGRLVARQPPDPVGAPPGEARTFRRIAGQSKDGQRAAQRLAIGRQSLEAEEQQVPDPVADLHCGDLLRREGIEHGLVHPVEPGVDHLRRAAGKSQAGAVRRDIKLVRRHGQRRLAPAVEAGMLAEPRRQSGLQLVESHVERLGHRALIGPRRGRRQACGPGGG